MRREPSKIPGSVARCADKLLHRVQTEAGGQGASAPATFHQLPERRNDEYSIISYPTAQWPAVRFIAVHACGGAAPLVLSPLVTQACTPCTIHGVRLFGLVFFFGLHELCGPPRRDFR